MGVLARSFGLARIEFEALAPESHQDFLESLGIPPSEIASIRNWSRERRTS